MKKFTKNKIIENIIVTSTLRGALTRNRVYNLPINENDRKQLRIFLGKQMSKELNKILSKPLYSDKDHFNTIISFSDRISADKYYGKYLFQKRLRIGTSQKLINLYWKMTWILKPGIKPPLHCPFDGIIIKELDKSVSHIRWTKLDNIKEYKHLVAAVKKKTEGKKTIADWELETYGEKTIPD